MKQRLTDSDHVGFLPVVAERPLKLKTPILPTEQPESGKCLFLRSGAQGDRRTWIGLSWITSPSLTNQNESGMDSCGWRDWTGGESG